MTADHRKNVAQEVHKPARMLIGRAGREGSEREQEEKKKKDLPVLP